MKTMNKISFLLLSIIMFTSCESEYKLSIKAPSKAILEDKIKINFNTNKVYAFDESGTLASSPFGGSYV